MGTVGSVGSGGKVTRTRTEGNLPVTGKTPVSKGKEFFADGCAFDNHQHPVVKGDTLFSLSRRFNVSMASLMAANRGRIGDNAAIRAGGTLTIPGWYEHRLQPKQTLWGLARELKVDPMLIAHANKLVTSAGKIDDAKARKLQVGSPLIVPYA